MEIQFATIGFVSFIALATMSSILFTTTITTATTTTTTTTEQKPRRPVVKLIHRDSVVSLPHSHRHNTIAERDDLEVELVGDESGVLLLVNFSIGQPPVPQLAIMDTGSNLLWIQCHPCENCHRQASPMLDPSRSSTYEALSCHSPTCETVLNHGCGPLQECTYNVTHMGPGSSAGEIATDELTFETTGEGLLNVVPRVLFGCGHENKMHKDEQISGVYGLGPGTTSIATQIGSKFSYCIGNLSDPNYADNHLVFGDGGDLEGSSTPFEPFEDAYHVNLEGISVGEERLDIDPRVFRRSPERGGGVIIGTGSPSTTLVKPAVDALKNKVRSILDGRFVRPDTDLFLCYEGVISRDLKGFPAVTFHFAGGADLVLDSESFFFQNGVRFCMTVIPPIDDYSNLSMIGIDAQQYYNVGYDIVGRKIYFQRIDCELLTD